MPMTSTREKVLRVALIDDHPIVREGMRSALVPEHGLELVAEGASVDEAVEIAEKHDLDVVLMDLRLQGPGGVEGIRRLKEVKPELATVVFTIYDSESSLVEALLAGARGYILKDSRREEITAAIRAAVQGDSVQIPRELLVRVLRGLPWVQAEAGGDKGGQASRLTNRELDVLKLMSQGLAYRAIGGKLHLAESTVKKYAHSLIGKLGASDRASAVIVAYRLGLVDGHESDE